MKINISIIAFLISLTICWGQGYLSSNGTVIVDGNGQPIQLKGITLANWLVPEGYMLQLENVDSPRKISTMITELLGEDGALKFWDKYLDNYITREDISFIKDKGFNHVRLFFHYKMLTDDDYMGRNKHGFKHIDNIIKWCEEFGIYVLLDMHCAPCGQSGENYDDSYGYPWLYTSEACQDRMISVWTEIAQRYKDNSTVMGYDILNAPIAPNFGEDMINLNKSLVNIYAKAMTEIQKIDSNHLIFVQFPEYHENIDVLEKLNGENIVFSLQRYYTQTDQSSIQKYIDFGIRKNAPIYVCEAGENKLLWIEEIRNLFEKNNVSWCFHPYKKINAPILYIEADDPSAVVSFKKPEDWKLINDYGASDRGTFNEIRDNKPKLANVIQIFDEFLENIKLKNCNIHTEFTDALGVK